MIALSTCFPTSTNPSSKSVPVPRATPVARVQEAEPAEAPGYGLSFLRNFEAPGHSSRAYSKQEIKSTGAGHNPAERPPIYSQTAVLLYIFNPYDPRGKSAVDKPPANVLGDHVQF